MKATAICSYVFTALCFVTCACFFALSNNWYWLFLILGLINLYNGFVITSVKEKMTEVNLGKKQNIKFLVCWILSIVCPPAFILNGIAYFRNTGDELVIRKNVEATEEAEPVSAEIVPQPAPEADKKLSIGQKVKAFCKKKSFITACVSLGLIFIFGFCAMTVETSGFSVKISDFTLTKEMTLSYNEGKINGTAYTISDKYYYMKDGLEVDVSADDRKSDDEGASWYTEVDGKKINLKVASPTYSVTMYVPKTATEENPAPTVFVLPGFTRTKASMAQYCIELSRRGAVAFCMDPGGQGATTETSTAGANGIEYLVQYVYNNSDDFKFCDKTRFGAIGHSAGGGNVTTLAADMSGATYQESVIKSVYISGYIKESAANKYKNLKCNAALSYAYYDEGAYRYQGDTSAYEVIALRFLNEVNGSTVTYDKVMTDYGYGSMADGTYRIIHREKINHCFEMYDGESIANSVNFFNESLNMGSDVDGFSQIWFGKEFFNGLALASAFTFVIALCAVLMNTPFFATIKKGKKKTAEAPEGTADGMQSVATVKTASLSAKEKAPKTVAHKVIFWSCMILTAIIACLDYIPLANLSIEKFPTASSASVFTFTFPARMINAILLWAAINGAIGLVIFFGTTLLENLYEYLMWKIKGVTPQYDWQKFHHIKISGEKWYGVIFNVLKAILLALIMFASFYFLLQLSYWAFHQDFRFLLISASPLNARMFVTALEYMPIIFVFYISNSIRVNCSIGHEGWKEWKVLLVSALGNSLGLAFILLINYFCYFTTGSPFYGNWGNENEVWLFVNMVFGLVVMMFILPIFNRLLYKITGNVWTGAIACCMIFIMMTISASVSYIPMY